MVNSNGNSIIDVQRPANGGEAIDNLAQWYVAALSLSLSLHAMHTLKHPDMILTMRVSVLPGEA